MTNNQRFCAELAVLFTLGTILWVKAQSQEAAKPNTLATLTVQRIEIVDAVNGNRTVLDGKQIQILDHNGRERAEFGLGVGDNNTILLMNDNRNVPRVTLTSSARFAFPSDVRYGAALVLKGDAGETILAMPHGKDSREITGLRVRKSGENP